MERLKNIQHLYWRAGFGLSPSQWQSKASLEEAIQRLFSPSKAIKELIVNPDTHPSFQELRSMSREDRKKLQKSARQEIKTLNLNWLGQMSQSPDPLRDKMALFWHGHFACEPRNIFHAQVQLATLRKHALGKLEDLVLAIAKDPAMLQYLNNVQNRKQKPNENFARELMELFTLGRGHYTEKDIKESARAFTGWAFEKNDFKFRSLFHDYGSKIFMGQSGNWNGEDIIRMILEKKQSARFIVQKIYRFFVNDQLPSQRMEDLSEYFYRSGYDIGKLMRKIFESEWFYEPENIATKIKSPVEYLIGLQRQFNIQVQKPESLLFLQKALGQILFKPPNVAGWTGGKDWIDSSRLLLRLKLPEVLYYSSELNFQLNDEGDAQMKFIKKRDLKRFEAEFKWAELEKLKNSADDYSELENYLLLKPSKHAATYVKERLKYSPDVNPFRNTAVLLCTLPEYQLC